MHIYCLGPVSPRFSTVSGATNATPIVVTLASALGTGNNALNPLTDVLTIGGVVTNTNANGSFAPGAYVINSPTTISLTGVAGNGAYGGGGIASAPQRLIYLNTPYSVFPTIPGVTDLTHLMVARVLFTPTPAGTASLLVGTAGLNQGNWQNIFRPINPPPATGIYDYYDLDADSNVWPIGEYWVDAIKPSTEAVLTSFWIK